jgi:uncharacterized membrane protein
MAFSLQGLVLLFHVVGAAAWFGAAGFALLIIRPAAMGAGPAGKAFLMEALRRGGFGKWFGPAAIVTVAAGLYLYFDLEMQRAPFDGAPAAMLTVGGILGLAAFAASLAGAVPLENKMKAIVAQVAPGAPPTPEQASELDVLGAKLYGANVVSVALLGLAMVLMAGNRIFV